MALTKVSGGILDPGINVAGIVTATGFDGPFIGGIGDHIIAGIITATGLDINGNADVSGIVTCTGLDLNGNGDVSGNFVIGGDLTVNGTTTTIDTNLIGVDKIEVTTAGTNVAVAVTHNGSGDLVRLYDGTSQVVTVDDTGNVGIGSAIPSTKLDVNGTSKFQDNVSFTTANGNGIIISKSSNYMMFGNSVTQYFGGSSMWLMHNGSTGYLHNVSGSLYIRNESAGDIYIQGKSGENSIICNDDGAVELYHDNLVRLTTTSTGVQIANGSADINLRSGAVSATGQGQLTFENVDGNGQPRDVVKIIGASHGNGGYGELRLQTAFDNNLYTRLTITENGNVGIGSEIPAAKLDVVGSLRADGSVRIDNNGSPTLYLTSTSTTGSSRIFFGDPDSDLVGRMAYAHNGDYFTFYAAYGERFRIAGNGDITVTSIDANATGPTLKLFHNSGSPAANDVVSRISMFGDDAAGNETEYGRIETVIDDTTNSQETAHMNFSPIGYSVTNTVFRIKRRGSASAPSYTADDADGIILDVYNTGNPYPRYMNFIAKSSGNTDSNITFWTEAVGGSPTEKLRINSDGDVLISHTTTPSADIKLLVGGNAGVTDGKYFSFRASYGNTSEPAAHAIKFDSAIGSSGGLHYYGYGGMHFDLGGQPRIQFTQTGNILPNAVGSLDIGSTSAEIGDVYLADDKRLKLGSDQDMLVYHDNTHGYVSNRKNNLYVEAPNYVMITSTDTNGSNQQTSARFLRGGSAEIYHSDSLKFETTGIGVSVHGEVAASQDYPNYRPTLNFNFAAEKKLEPRIIYERTGSASFVNEFGKVVLVGDNDPRFDHHPDTKESLGLLIEPKKTNLWLYSEDLVTYVTGGEMQQSTLENTTATTDPTGGTNAVKMAATATGGAHSFYKYFSSGSNGNVHTASVWVKAAGVDYARLYVDTVGGNMGGPGVTFSTGNTWNVSASGSATQTATSVVKYPNGWWRLSVSGSFSSQNAYYVHIDLEGGEGDVSFTGNGSDGMYVWGVQFESSTQTNVTSYIPTYGAAVTRGDDIVILDGEDFTDFYNQEEGTLVSEFKIFDRIQSSAAIANINALSSSSYADSIMFMEVGHTDGYFGRVYKNSNGISLNGSSDQTSIVQNGNQTNKVSFGWSATSVNQGLAAYLNGTLQEQSTDESRTPTNMTELRIGTGWQQNSNENQTWAIHAHIKKLMYYPKRLPNNQLATLTS